MSHIVKIQTQVRDEAAVIAAGQRRQLATPERANIGSSAAKSKGWPCGCVTIIFGDVEAVLSPSKSSKRVRSQRKREQTEAISVTRASLLELSSGDDSRKCRRKNFFPSIHQSRYVSRRRIGLCCLDCSRRRHLPHDSLKAR